MPAPAQTSLGLPLGARPAGTKAASVISNPRIWAIGDSLTAGSGGTTGWAWRQHVGRMLDDAGVAFTSVGSVSSASTTWPNHWGVSGKTAAQIEADMVADGTIFTAADPDIVMLCPIGQNDINLGGTATDARDAVDSLLTYIRGLTNGRSATPRVVTAKVIGHRTSDATMTAFAGLMDAVYASQISAGLDLHVADFRTSGRRPLVAGLDDSQHPNDMLYQSIASAIFPTLLNAIGLDADWGRSIRPGYLTDGGGRPLTDSQGRYLYA